MRVIRLILLSLVLLSLTLSVRAQDATPVPPPYPLIVYGEVAAGRLNDATPRQVYTFEGLRGEYIDVRLRTTSGNLDAVLLVLDDTGKPLRMRDDAAGSTDPVIHLLRIPRNGRYSIVVGRFGYAMGSTEGSYELMIERIGVSFESGSALRYGDTVTNNVSDTQPLLYYTFNGQRGDIITVTMRGDSGNLDPKLQIVSLDGRILAENDDLIPTEAVLADGTAAAPASKDSQIANFILEDTATYVIIATRYGELAGTSSGDFFLTLERADNSGMGTSPQVAIRLEAGETAEGEITDARLQVYYTFTARRDDLVTVRMNRLAGGNLDTYLSLLNSSQQEIASNDDLIEGNQNSQIPEFLIPADGTYYIVATRFEGAAGTTSGRYRLELIAVGNAFENLAEGAGRLVYGGTASGTINSQTESVLYAFYGVQGDTITVTMNRSEGTLLPSVQLLDSTQRLLTVNGNPGSANALIERYTLPRTGIYYLRASRVPETSATGEYILVLNRRFDN